MTLSLYTFAIMMRRKRGMDSIGEIPHGEGLDHAVGSEQEHPQVLQPAEHGGRDSTGDGDARGRTLTTLRVARVTRDADPAACRCAGGPPKPTHVRCKARPWMKTGGAPSAMKTDDGHCDEREGTIGEKYDCRCISEEEERAVGTG
jgi:hypothetical protein